MLNLGAEEEPVVHVYSVVSSEPDSEKKERHTFVIKAGSRDIKEAISEKELFERLQVLRAKATPLKIDKIVMPHLTCRKIYLSSITPT